MREVSDSSASHTALMRTLKIAGGILAIFISPLLAIWFDYPLALPRFDAVVLEKMLLTFVWLVFVLGLYYREKVNSLYKLHSGRR